MLGVEFHKLYVWTPSTKGIVRVTFPPILSPPKGGRLGGHLRLPASSSQPPPGGRKSTRAVVEGDVWT